MCLLFYCVLVVTFGIKYLKIRIVVYYLFLSCLVRQLLRMQLNNTYVLEDTHPRLQPSFLRNQVMVYDSTIEPTRSKIESMLDNCQRSVDDNEKTWPFIFR